MSASRIGKSAINWVELAKRVPEHQKHMYTQFKTLSDGYLQRVLFNPPEAPAIDWALYKSKIPLPGMVEDFQKQYGALNIPYPPNTVQEKLDNLETEIKQDIATFKKESDLRLVVLQKKLDHVNSLLPFDQMTMEDICDMYPEVALDPLNRPTHWPHENDKEQDQAELSQSQVKH